MALECCPVGHVYIDINGSYDDPGFGAGTVGNPPGVAGCVRVITNLAGVIVVVGGVTDPFECPCCQNGYEFSSYKQVCMTTSAPFMVSEPIPCIICPPCPDPVPFVCEDCGTDGIGINFTFDFHRKNCIDCEPEDDNGPIGSIECFIPANYLDPIIANFRLKNRNFI